MPYHTWSRFTIGALAVIALVPFTLLAQTSEENKIRLEQEIRAALLSDTRSQELSQEELDALVASLMGEVEAQGAVEDYVEVPVSPNTFSAQSGGEGGGTLPFPEPIVYGAILLLLALAIFFLQKVIRAHHKSTSDLLTQNTSK